MDPSSKPSPPAGVVTCCNGHGHAGNGHAGNGRTAANGCRGVLLLNLGTPDEPDVPSVRRYLSEFLSDRSLAPAQIRLRVSSILLVPTRHGAHLPQLSF